VVYYGPILITQGFGPAGPKTEVYDAELMGAVEELRATMNQPCIQYATRLTILLDNLAAASLLADNRPAPHRCGLTDTFQQLSIQWKEASSLLNLSYKPLEVRWIPGHSGVVGNELADQLAKQGATINGSHIPPSPSYLRREAKQKLRADTSAAYIKTASQAYHDLNIRPHTKHSHAQEHNLPRWILGRLIAACTGHEDFAAYHERFHHSDYLATCSCNRLKSPTHFFFCPHTRKCWKNRWKCQKASLLQTIN
jgi:ribonuclease HI